MSGYGSFAVGGVFEISQGNRGWAYSILYTHGAGPGLLTDGLGLPNCGGYTCGEVFKLTPQRNGTWKYSAL